MLSLSVLFLCLVSTPVWSSVKDETQNLCSELEFFCGGGSCISLSSLCDGRRDCDNGSDEATCNTGTGSLWLSREKRQTRTKCPNDQWQCADGTCINADALRDGTNDCPDGSDEMSYICDSSKQFQCKDTSCIPLDFKCNSVRDCSDGSDEINPDCGAELQIGFIKHPKYPDPIQRIQHLPGVCYMPPYPVHGSYVVHSRPTAGPGEVFKTAVLIVSCDPGYEVSGSTDLYCFDGTWSHTVPDCVLTTEICVLPEFPAHASYIVVDNPEAEPRQAYDDVELNITCDPGYDIDGQTSIVVVCHNGRWSGEISDCILTSGACILPPFPKHGGYEVSGVADAKPGQTFVRVTLNITCLPGYGIHGDSKRTCYNGMWSGNLTDCLESCHLPKDPSVEYRCFQPDRECGQDEPDGTVVTPVCKPNYFFPGEFSEMRCKDGKWSYVAQCVPVSTGACVLPPFPENGTYIVAGFPEYVPGQALVSVSLTIQCHPGFDIVETKDITCYSGIWSGEVSNCVPKSELCILPPPPSNGWYAVPAALESSPGDVFYEIALEYKCTLGFNISGSSKVTCRNGNWSAKIDACTRVAPFFTAPTLDPAFNPAYLNKTTSPKLTGFCRLEKDPSVNYRCLLSAASPVTRDCKEIEPIGTLVRPECKVPNYYFPGVLNHMRCLDDKWNYIARCVPECGLVTPKGTELVIGGRAAERGELPWHAGIYQKAKSYVKQICGGSLVSPKVVISAGHCFVDKQSRKLPATDYSVALGKVYRKWDHEMDQDVQKSELSDLKFPSRFSAGFSNYQEDLALLFLVETIVYQKHIRPVCMDFSIEIENQQLQSGSLGKVAGWGLTSANAGFADVLKTVELPYVSIETCQDEAPQEFREFITGDKICAGYRNGTSICLGDSGGGLTFPRASQGKTRYYLRGVASSAPVNGTSICNAFWYSTFTQISRHERFIKDNIRL